MKRHTLNGLFVLLALSATCAAATLNVDLNGGADYTEIQSAIDAAEDGDTVLVRPGEYVIAEPINFNRLRCERWYDCRDDLPENVRRDMETGGSKDAASAWAIPSASYPPSQCAHTSAADRFSAWSFVARGSNNTHPSSSCRKTTSGRPLGPTSEGDEAMLETRKQSRAGQERTLRIQRTMVLPITLPRCRPKALAADLECGQRQRKYSLGGSSASWTRAGTDRKLSRNNNRLRTRSHVISTNSLSLAQAAQQHQRTGSSSARALRLLISSGGASRPHGERAKCFTSTVPSTREARSTPSSRAKSSNFLPPSGKSRLNSSARSSRPRTCNMS